MHAPKFLPSGPMGPLGAHWAHLGPYDDDDHHDDHDDHDDHNDHDDHDHHDFDDDDDDDDDVYIQTPDQPHSGRYWYIMCLGHTMARSTLLSDSAVAPTAFGQPATVPMMFGRMVEWLTSNGRCAVDREFVHVHHDHNGHHDDHDHQ